MTRGLRIGQVSKLFGISREGLRYYDRIGLFRPDEVDSESGYRYYSLRRLERLLDIMNLKGLGMPLEKIREHLHSEKTLAGSLQWLEEQAGLLDGEIRRLSAMKERVERSIDSLKNAYPDAGTSKIEIRHLAECAMMPLFALSGESIQPLDVSSCSPTEKAPALNMTSREILFSLPLSELENGHYDNILLGVQLEETERLPGNIRFPEGEYAVTLHHGNYEDISKTYLRLLSFIAEQDMVPVSDSLERGIVGPALTDHTEAYVTEICIALKKP